MEIIKELGKSNSLLAKYLTQNIYDALKEKTTSTGFSLERAIASGVQNSDSNIGIYAGDAQSYETFAAIFRPIIDEYHTFKGSHQSSFITSVLKDDLPKGYIKSTRIRVARNLKDYAFGTMLSKEERLKVQKEVIKALETLQGSLKGKFFSLETLSEQERTRLTKEHFLFKEGDRFLEAAGLNRDWPSGRGIFLSEDKHFLVWVNEEDELRIISMQEGENILEVFERLKKALEALEQQLNFAYDTTYGYLTTCPTNLGTAMRASVHICLPKLAKQPALLEEVASEYALQIRGTHGEHSAVEGGVFDISNKQRLGITEAQAVEKLYEGVKVLIQKEQSFE